jgi:hypothetical protein
MSNKPTIPQTKSNTNNNKQNHLKIKHINQPETPTSRLRRASLPLTLTLINTALNITPPPNQQKQNSKTEKEKENQTFSQKTPHTLRRTQAVTPLSRQYLTLALDFSLLNCNVE